MSKIVVGEDLRDFKFMTPYKKNLVLSEVIDGKKTFLVFLRYYGCSICQLDIMELFEKQNEFIEKDTNIYIVLQSAALLMENMKVTKSNYQQCF